MAMGRILVVDDESGLRSMLEVILRRDGHTVTLAADGHEALTALAADPKLEICLCDLRMEPMGGLELLEKSRTRFPDVFVVIMTAFAEWDTAVRAMRSGAYNFLRKPFDNGGVRSLVNRAIHARDRHIAAKLAGEHGSPVHFIGSSQLIQGIQQLIEQVSTTDSTVLVTGESGSGKELVARGIHYASLRADGPLVRINSGALTPSLLESELFGHVKGAFTGAVEARPGLFTLATGGTLFLDEVGELAVETQVKLLRVLETGEFTAVGGRETLTSDVRLVAATNRDLGAMVKAGTFREDLYYRLAVIPIQLPPLRERKEDIPLLAGHLLARHAVKLRRGVTGFTKTAIDAMMAYDWPGNIRELDNCIQRGVALVGSGDIEATHLFGDGVPAAAPEAGTGDGGGPAHDAAILSDRIASNQPINLEQAVIAYERVLVEAALQRTGDNLTEAAKLVGISFRQMRYKVRQLGLR
jgi:DNA-binding NtrC family response regulator